MDLSSLPVVVLVECDPLVRYGYSVLIGDWGYAVLARASVAEAADDLASLGGQVGALVLGQDSATAEDGLAGAAALVRDMGGVPAAIIAGRLPREILDRAARLRIAVLSETDEPDRLEDWLRTSLTAAAAIGDHRGRPGD
jgi:DNA-binding NarL/FixJ family response regulator